jgi:HEAT repeat protein
MVESILEQKAKGKRQKAKLFPLLCALCLLVVNSFSQTLDFYAEKIRNGSAEEKRSALFDLRNLETPEASRIAVPALRDKDEMVRVTAAYSVVFLPPDEAAQALLPNLGDKSVYVRKETSYALGKARSSIAVRPLVEIMGRDKAPDVRSAAIVALGEIGDVAAVDSLLEALQQPPKDAGDFFRRSAVRAIGQIAQVQQVQANYVVTPESTLPEKYDVFANLKYTNLAEKFPVFRQSISLLLPILQNQKESDDVRREAAFALGSIGDESAISTLQNNLSARDYYLVEICRESLQKILSGRPV